MTRITRIALPLFALVLLAPAFASAQTPFSGLTVCRTLWVDASTPIDDDVLTIHVHNPSAIPTTVDVVTSQQANGLPIFCPPSLARWSASSSGIQASCGLVTIPPFSSESFVISGPPLTTIAVSVIYDDMGTGLPPVVLARRLFEDGTFQVESLVPVD